MTNYICEQCGVQFAGTQAPPDLCPICEDERQYVNWKGQRWTTLEKLRRTHSNTIKPEGPEIFGVGTDPKFAIGQRALLLRTPGGNVLWDCISLIDDATVEAVRELGGISAIAISHPHYYSAMVEWSRTFGAPIYLHAADREWVMRPDPEITSWEGDTLSIGEGLTLIRCGTHFDGGTVLHWRDGAEGRGVLLSGDVLQVVADRRHVSFMRSYPNLIPERASNIRRAINVLEPFGFERIYGAFWDFNILSGAEDAVARSAARYLDTIENEPRDRVGGKL